MLATLLQFAATEGAHETDKTAFYAIGAVLALWAVAISAAGIMRHETFPPSAGGRSGVIAITALLVAATMAASILTS